MVSKTSLAFIIFSFFSTGETFLFGGTELVGLLGGGLGGRGGVVSTSSSRISASGGYGGKVSTTAGGSGSRSEVNVLGGSRTGSGTTKDASRGGDRVGNPGSTRGDQATNGSNNGIDNSAFRPGNNRRTGDFVLIG